tara:strand:+ start:521 stop:727 length:207 start_codon:yes stop_codon:yes gene_type:complete
LGFFGLRIEDKKYIHEEVFSLVHYGKGFTFQDAYSMPIHLRKYYLKKIVDVAKAKEKELNKVRASKSR